MPTAAPTPAAVPAATLAPEVPILIFAALAADLSAAAISSGVNFFGVPETVLGVPGLGGTGGSGAADAALALAAALASAAALAASGPDVTFGVLDALGAAAAFASAAALAASAPEVGSLGAGAAAFTSATLSLSPAVTSATIFLLPTPPSFKI
jgi:hypothetical protein